MKIDCFDQKGKKGEAITLPKELVEAKPNATIVAQAVRVNLMNARQGTRSTKGRSDLHYSNRKIYKQKGTGRARHGDRTANIFTHGAVAHGPKPITRKVSMPRAMKIRALKSAIALVVRENRLFVIDKVEFSGKGASGKAAELFKKLGFKKATIVRGEKEHLGLGVRNLKGVSAVNAVSLSTYDVVNANNLLFTKEALETLKKRLSTTKDEK